MHRTQNPNASAADTIDDATLVVTPADILRGAARYLETHGWIQGNYYNADGGAFPAACALGARGRATCARGAYPRSSRRRTARDHAHRQGHRAVA